MGTIRTKKLTNKELDGFKKIILDKRDVLSKELADAKENADEVLKNNSCFLFYDKTQNLNAIKRG